MGKRKACLLSQGMKLHPRTRRIKLSTRFQPKIVFGGLRPVRVRNWLMRAAAWKGSGTWYCARRTAVIDVEAVSA